jgi:GTPase involved in cell partitioning and DNA repair
MKKLLLVCLLALGTSAMSFAQGGPGGGRGGRTPEAQLEALKAAVTGITADQATKIMAIYTASTKKSDSIRTAAGDDMQSAFPKMTEVRTAAREKVKALLTADQQKQFDAMPQGRGPGGGGPGGPGGGGAPRP